MLWQHRDRADPEPAGSGRAQGHRRKGHVAEKAPALLRHQGKAEPAAISQGADDELLGARAVGRRGKGQAGQVENGGAVGRLFGTNGDGHVMNSFLQCRRRAARPPVGARTGRWRGMIYWLSSWPRTAPRPARLIR